MDAIFMTASWPNEAHMKGGVIAPFVYKLTKVNTMFLGLGDVNMVMRQCLRKRIRLLKRQVCFLCAINMIAAFYLFVLHPFLLFGTNTSQYALPTFMMGTLSSELVLVGASIVCLKSPVLPLAL
jgi:hypothetical protein